MGCLALISVGTLKGVGQGCSGWLSSTWLVCLSGKSWVHKKLGNKRHWGGGGGVVVVTSELIIRFIYPLIFRLL